MKFDKKYEKLYQHLPKRIAKKYVSTIPNAHKLALAAAVKPGDLVSTCAGYNEVVREVYYYWRRCPYPLKRGFRRGAIVVSVDFMTTGGGCCSGTHCCTFPTETKAEILEYWKSQLAWAESAEGKESGWASVFTDCLVGKALSNGEDPFNEDGTLKWEYTDAHKKQQIDPDRYLKESALLQNNSTP